MSNPFDSLKGYTPMKMEDGFEVMKDKGLVCGVDYGRVELYSGEKPEFHGCEFFSYCLVVLDHPKYTGRKLWKKFNLNDEGQLKKLANVFFTVGLEFKDRTTFDLAVNEFVKGTYVVKAWGWKPEGENEAIQQHQIKGVASETVKAKSSDSIKF